ncbi:hypothetical protein [Mycolicibacterium doricum]|nr:hypothetical protein [Mycolicibacterium doricum]
MTARVPANSSDGSAVGPYVRTIGIDPDEQAAMSAAAAAAAS